MYFQNINVVKPYDYNTVNNSACLYTVLFSLTFDNVKETLFIVVITSESKQDWKL